MVYLTSTASDALTDSIAAGLAAAGTLLAISWVIGLIVLALMVAFITWIVKKVWYAGSNRKYKKQQKQWEKAQAKALKADTEYREFQEWKKQKETPAKKGFENNPDWYWDDSTGLWRYKGKK